MKDKEKIRRDQTEISQFIAERMQPVAFRRFGQEILQYSQESLRRFGETAGMGIQLHRDDEYHYENGIARNGYRLVIIIAPANFDISDIPNQDIHEYFLIVDDKDNIIEVVQIMHRVLH